MLLLPFPGLRFPRWQGGGVLRKGKRVTPVMSRTNKLLLSDIGLWFLSSRVVFLVKGNGRSELSRLSDGFISKVPFPKLPNNLVIYSTCKKVYLIPHALTACKTARSFSSPNRVISTSYIKAFVCLSLPGHPPQDAHSHAPIFHTSAWTSSLACHLMRPHLIRIPSQGTVLSLPVSFFINIFMRYFFSAVLRINFPF